MARRKTQILEDETDSDDSNQSGSDEPFDSQEDEDSRAERRLFEHRRKRQRRAGRSGKDAAWEGIFGGDDEGAAAKRAIGLRKRGHSSDSRTDWTKAPAFVSSNSRPAETKKADEAASDNDSPLERSGSDSDGSDSDSNQPETGPSQTPPAAADEGNSGDEVPALLGLGGIGIGFRPTASLLSRPTAEEPGSSVHSFPNRFATASQNQSQARTNFQPSRSTTPNSAPAPLTKAEQQHFSSISGSFGAKLLAKQGWAPGKGLGLNEDGRAVPVAVGKMARGEGIKSGIRTEDSKREARRKGELVEDEETKSGKQRGNRQGRPAALPNDGWKKHKKAKVPKVEHKTYEQLLLEDGGDAARPGVGLVLDARDGELKTLDSIADLTLSHWTPTSDATQLPELRHNLRLIVDVSKGDVAHLVREGKSINERRRWSSRDEANSRQKAEASVNTADQLRKIQSATQNVIAISKRQAASGSVCLERLEEPFKALLHAESGEYIALGLDEIVVGAIDLVLRTTFAQWQPFSVSSDALLSALLPWKRAFHLDVDEQALPSERTMTSWESMLWNRWLPNVRSVINNDWDVQDPRPAVHLIESWNPILPRFIQDNIIDQLILPKLLTAIEAWDGRPNREGKRTSLAAMLFPWLPIVGQRAPIILEEGKRRVRAVLRRWVPEDGVPMELKSWRTEIFSAKEWDKLMGESVLGKLGTTLQQDLQINPRKQDLQPLIEWVLPWYTLIRRSNFIRVLELEFFPKWLNVLYLWLVHPGYNSEEVAQWFEMWKGLFPRELMQHRAMSNGFAMGLDLMRTAMDLGTEAPSRLQRPAYEPQLGAQDVQATSRLSKPTTKPQAGPPEEITFRSVLEDAIADQDLIMVPLGKSHAITGKPLFRVGSSVDGKGGVTLFIGSDAVFVQNEGGEFRAMSLADVLTRAKM